jgi:hypothetical protein
MHNHFKKNSPEEKNVTIKGKLIVVQLRVLILTYYKKKQKRELKAVHKDKKCVIILGKR